VVYVTAKAPTEGSFSVELLSTPAAKNHTQRYSGGHIPLRLTVDLDQNTASLSSTAGGDIERTKQLDPRPFKPGEIFNLTIFAEMEGFEIGLEGAHLEFYKYPEHGVSYSNMALQLVGLTTIITMDYY